MVVVVGTLDFVQIRDWVDQTVVVVVVELRTVHTVVVRTADHIQKSLLLLLCAALQCYLKNNIIKRLGLVSNQNTYGTIYIYYGETQYGCCTHETMPCTHRQ